MDDLVQWLEQQLNEDERTARAASPGPWSTRWNGQDNELVAPSRTYPIAQWTYAIATQEPEASARRAECDTADADHIARHDPARVLAEVEAKRQILRALENSEVALRNTEPGKEPHDLVKEATNGLRATVRALAAVYADRPDYREEWRP